MKLPGSVLNAVNSHFNLLSCFIQSLIHENAKSSTRKVLRGSPGKANWRPPKSLHWDCIHYHSSRSDLFLLTQQCFCQLKKKAVLREGRVRDGRPEVLEWQLIVTKSMQSMIKIRIIYSCTLRKLVVHCIRMFLNTESSAIIFY